MYKLLVIDDEYYVRKRVINCIKWEQFQFDKILEAADGEEACNMIANNHIDLIIVDISMPKMNGLEFIQTVKDKNLSYGRDDIKMIILTGYDSFNYAQTALNLGVNYFLLKPVDGTQMREVVAKLMIQIKAEEAMKTQMLSLTELKKDEKLLYMFMNLFQEDSPTNLLHLFNMTEQEQYVMVRTRIFNRNEKKSNDDIIVEFIVENILEEVLSESFYVIKFEDTWKQIGFICKCQKENIQQLDGIVRGALSIIGKRKTVKVIAAISELFYGKLSSIREAYMNISTILFYSKPDEADINNIAHLKDINQSEMNIEKYLIMVEECLVKMDAAQMEHSLDHIFEDMEKNKCVIETLELIIQYIVIKFYAFAEKYMKEQDFIDFKASIKKIQINLGKDQSIQHIKKDMKQVFSFIAQNMKEKETVSGEQIKNRTMDYINHHYYNPELNLKMIADEVFLNANYLSTTFKRYHGNSINEYINMIRLEKAKKLIEETDLSIQSIAEKVGFSDQFYFSKKFKKKFSFSPLCFRYSCQK